MALSGLRQWPSRPVKPSRKTRRVRVLEEQRAVRAFCSIRMKLDSYKLSAIIAENGKPSDSMKAAELGLSLKVWTAATACIFGFSASIADTLYVSNSGSDTIEQFTPAGASVFANTGLNLPKGLALDSSGNLYVANYRGNTIMKFTPAGVGSVFATNGLDGPMGLAFDGSGNLYVANWDGNTIQKFTSGGASSVFATSGLDAPIALAFDRSGNLYVANGESTILKFTTSGAGSVFASTGLNAPSGLAFDDAGNLYVSNYGDGTIMKFTPAGAGSLFGNASFETSFGMAFDSAGNLFVANMAYQLIDKFTADGSRTEFAQDPGSLSLLWYPSCVAIRDDPAVVFLYARRSENQLLLSWPTNKVGFKLQSTLTLTPPVAWLDWTNPVAIVGTQFTATNAATGTARLFRLSK